MIWRRLAALWANLWHRKTVELRGNPWDGIGKFNRRLLRRMLVGGRFKRSLQQRFRIRALARSRVNGVRKKVKLGTIKMRQRSRWETHLKSFRPKKVRAA